MLSRRMKPLSPTNTKPPKRRPAHRNPGIRGWASRQALDGHLPAAPIRPIRGLVGVKAGDVLNGQHAAAFDDGGVTEPLRGYGPSLNAAGLDLDRFLIHGDLPVVNGLPTQPGPLGADDRSLSRRSRSVVVPALHVGLQRWSYPRSSVVFQVPRREALRGD